MSYGSTSLVPQNQICQGDPCAVTFWIPNLFRRHALQEHVPDAALQEHVPGFAKSKKLDRMDDEMAELIIKSSWKTLDRECTWKVLEYQLEGQGENSHVPAAARLSPYCCISPMTQSSRKDTLHVFETDNIGLSRCWSS